MDVSVGPRHLKNAQPSGEGRLFADFLKAGRRPVLFLLVGVWNTLVGFGLYACLLAVAPSMSPVAALIATGPLAITQAYFAQRKWVWRSTERRLVEFPPFVGVYAISLLANAVVLFVLSRLLPPLPAQAVALTVTAALSYFLHLTWTFRAR